MKLSAKAITTYNTVNSFNYGNQWAIRGGEENTLYFQLVDLDQASLRYLAGVTAAVSINVSFPSVDDDAVITVAATQVDVNDKSIWKIDLTDAQRPSSGNVVFAITEGTKTKRFSALAFILVEGTGSEGECC